MTSTMEELAFYERLTPLFSKYHKREPTEEELSKAWKEEQQRQQKTLEALRKIQGTSVLSHEEKTALLRLLVGENTGSAIEKSASFPPPPSSSSVRPLPLPTEFLPALDEDLLKAYLPHPDSVMKQRQLEFDGRQANETRPYTVARRTGSGPEEREMEEKKAALEHDPEHDSELEEEGQQKNPVEVKEMENALKDTKEGRTFCEQENKNDTDSDNNYDDDDDDDNNNDSIDLGDEEDERRRLMRERKAEQERIQFEKQHDKERLEKNGEAHQELNLNEPESHPISSSAPSSSTPKETETGHNVYQPLERIACSRLEPPAFWETSDIGYKELEVAPRSEEHRWLQGLFTQTIANYHRRRNRFKFNSYTVTKIVRVQNPALWMRYTMKRAEILNDCNGAAPPIDKVLTQPSTNPAVNEYFFFHGLDVKKIGKITRFGFDVRFSSLEGMFGAAIYLSENSSKSDQYMHSERCNAMGANAEDCQCRPDDELKQLVCRVTLGDAFLEAKYQGNEPGQFWCHRRVEPTKQDGSNYHSVVAESRKNCKEAKLRLREYVVYDTCQVYPEYIVHYHRTI